jgi:hypothetical protein
MQFSGQQLKYLYNDCNINATGGVPGMISWKIKFHLVHFLENDEPNGIYNSRHPDLTESSRVPDFFIQER